jgi:hypothetical protein
MKLTSLLRSCVQLLGTSRSVGSATAALLIMLATTSAEAAPITYNTIALSGQQAPGTTSGVNYSSFGNSLINGAGQTAFSGFLLQGTAGVTTSNDQGIWSEGSGTLALLAREGNVAPGTSSGVNYSFFNSPVLNSTGQVAFFGFLTGTGVTASNDSGIWSEGSGTLALVAREGNVAPGTTSALFGNLANSPVINGAGQTAFSGTLLQGTAGVNGFNDSGIWSEGSGTLALLAREGNVAPGTTSALFGNLANSPVINSAGQTAFFGTLLQGTAGVTASNDTGIWSEGSGTLALVAREGNVAPGTTSALFGSFGNPVINGAGQTAFVGSLQVGTAGVTTSNDQGIWSEGSGTLALLAREGNVAPGTTSALFGNFTSSFPVINGAGQTAFFGSLLVGTAGVTASNDTGIWSEGSGTLALVAREGNVAPGTTSALFNNFGSTVINGAGQTAFFGSLLQGTAGVTASNDQGLWAESPDGLTLILRKGDLFDVDPGIGIDNRTISFITFTAVSGGEDGRGMTFNNDGTLAFRLNFTDGSSGIFTSTIAAIPEPSTYAVMAMGLGVLGWVRLRRQRAKAQA